MEFLPTIIVAGIVFGLCFLLDKGFTKIFRSKAQHTSGRSVRVNKHYGGAGTVLLVLGVAAVLSGVVGEWALVAGGCVLILVGVALIVYYMAFGIYYDDDSFVYSTFGKKSVTYQHNQIRGQQLYTIQGGHILVELHMANGSAVQVQLNFNGAEDFLNTAFLGWVRQKNLDMREGNWDFHDPQNSCWFPKVEDC